MRKIICIPTYNEKENLEKLLPVLQASYPETHFLIIDDNSPDGTASLVEAYAQGWPNLHILKRSQKQWLGPAYVAGFKWGIENGFEAIGEMDADFSHRPVDLKKLLDAVETSDFVVGSRYIQGGGTENWGWLRRFISQGGGIYSRIILGYPLADWTGGFNLWRSDVLKKIGLSAIQSNGYSFQIELKYKALKNGFKGTEVPIIFSDRRVGQSKMSLRIVIEAFYRVWMFRFSSHRPQSH